LPIFQKVALEISAIKILSNDCNFYKMLLLSDPSTTLLREQIFSKVAVEVSAVIFLNSNCNFYKKLLLLGSSTFI